MNFKPLHIVLEILSPIELPKYPISLDGLLYWAIKENSSLNDTEILEYLDSTLDKEKDIYKASTARMIHSRLIPLLRTEITHPSRTHWQDWSTPLDRGDKKNPPTRIEVKGGPFRKRMTTRNGVLVGFIDFHAVGDAEKIKNLLNLLGFIGLSNNQGFGQIGDIQIEEISNDYSFYDENDELARVLPKSVARQDDINNYLLSINSYRPPYATSQREPCVIPEFRLFNHLGA